MWVWKYGEVMGMTDREKVIKGLECHKRAMYGSIDEHGHACNLCPYKDMDNTCRPRTEGNLIDDTLALLKAQEPTQWHKEGCAKNSSICVVDIGNDMPALLAAVVVNGRFIFDDLDITEKVRHWFAIPGIKTDGQAVKWE